MRPAPNPMSGTFRAFLAEFVGTFCLVLLAAGAAASGAAPALVALAYGLAASVCLFAFAQGGGHFNPALTAASLLMRRADGPRAALILAAQLLGAALAGLYLQGHAAAGAAPAACALSGVGFRSATLAEALGAFFIASAYFASAAEPRRGAAPLAVGAATAAAALVFAPSTGGAFNPARAFGPSVATGLWAHWYVYWIGPLAGAAASALLFENFLVPEGGRKSPAKDKTAP